MMMGGDGRRGKTGVDFTAYCAVAATLVKAGFEGKMRRA
jgi:hypothetical protein